MKRSENILYNSFKPVVLIQLLLLGVTTIIFVLLKSHPYFILTRYIVIALWFLQIAIIFRYVVSRENKYIDMVRSLRHETGYFGLPILTGSDSGSGFSFELNRLINEFRMIRLEKEKDFTFFRYALQELPVGLLAYNEKGEVKILNKEMKFLMGLKNQETIGQININNNVNRLVRELMESGTSLKKVVLDNEVKCLYSKVITLQIENEQYTFVSAQNINEEVHKIENITLRRMFRILSHEMINSLNPITFLSSGLLNMIESDTKNKVIYNEPYNNEFISGLKAINKRSVGLTEFINRYKEQMQIAVPEFSEVNITSLGKQIEDLFRTIFAEKNIRFETGSNSENIIIKSDERLLMQTLINLIKNAAESVEGIKDPQIIMRSTNKNDTVIIEVADNGPGIDGEHIPEIFSPFYSTKENGTGLGLYFSRQVIDALGGEIKVESGKGHTSFRLILKKCK